MSWLYRINRRINRRFLLRYRFEYTVAVVVVYGVRALSPAFAWSMAREIGRLLYRLGVRRKTLDKNLLIAFPEKSDAARRRIAKGAMEHFSSMVVDIIFQRRMIRPGNFSRRFTLTGWVKEYFDHYGVEGFQHRSRRRLFLSAHIGNWELAPGFFNMMGVKITPIYRRPNNPYLDRLLRRIRLDQQEQVIERRGSVQAMLECFEEGGNVGFVFDQEAVAGLEVPFFGTVAHLHKTPAVLVRDYDIKVVFGTMIRRGDFLDYETIGKMILYDRKTDDRDADLQFITEDLMKRLEGLIREYPEHSGCSRPIRSVAWERMAV